MTRERAKELAPIIAAYGEGKKIEGREASNNDDFFEITDAQFHDDWEYRIKPEPVARPMTRGEVLYMVTTTPGMVARASRSPRYFAASDLGQWDHPERAEYAIIDKHGDPIDGWHKFEVTE